MFQVQQMSLVEVTTTVTKLILTPDLASQENTTKIGGTGFYNPDVRSHPAQCQSTE